MEDTIRKIIKIDNNYKEMLEEVNNRNENIQKYIKQEIAIKKGIYEAEKKEEIEQKKIEYNNMLDKRRNELTLLYNSKKRIFESKYNEQKEQIKMQIFSDIIGDDE